MIYVSHLLRDEEMKELVEELQVGVESIEFSISENLDHLSEFFISPPVSSGTAISGK